MQIDFGDLTHSDPAAIVLVSVQGQIADLNPAAGRLLGLSPADNLLTRLETPREEAIAFLRACSRSTEPHFGRLDLREGETVRSMRCDGALLRPPRSEDRALLVLRLLPLKQTNNLFVALNDQITELHAEILRRRHAEIRVTQALAEKDVLLREVQHRVRNNMQLIASMVELEARRSPSARDALAEVGSRVRAVALAQEQLYERESVSDIEISAYLNSLVRATEALRRGDIRFLFTGEPVVVPLDKAVPLGLIVNELLTNAAKHAFPTGKGTVRVVVAIEDITLAVEVSDDGVGLPSGANAEIGGSLGFRLMRQLAIQAGASLRMEGTSGVRARIVVDLQGAGVASKGPS